MQYTRIKYACGHEEDYLYSTTDYDHVCPACGAVTQQEIEEIEAEYSLPALVGDNIDAARARRGSVIKSIYAAENYAMEGIMEMPSPEFNEFKAEQLEGSAAGEALFLKGLQALTDANTWLNYTDPVDIDTAIDQIKKRGVEIDKEDSGESL